MLPSHIHGGIFHGKEALHRQREDGNRQEVQGIDFERYVKPFVVARKVFQTSGSEAGDRHAVRLFSIVRTAMINGLDPYRCLEFALENVGRKPIEAIFPYSKDLEIR